MDDPTDFCRCGHQRMSHIYHEGACRPGFVCDHACEEYQPGGMDPLADWDEWLDPTPREAE